MTKAPGTRAFGFPANGSVQFNHPVFEGSGPHKPGIQGIIQNRLVGAPTMGITVLVFLDAKGLTGPLEFEGNEIIRAQ